jgi:hypothetical protein
VTSTGIPGSCWPTARSPWNSKLSNAQSTNGRINFFWSKIQFRCPNSKNMTSSVQLENMTSYIPARKTWRSMLQLENLTSSDPFRDLGLRLGLRQMSWSHVNCIEVPLVRYMERIIICNFSVILRVVPAETRTSFACLLGQIVVIIMKTRNMIGRGMTQSHADACTWSASCRKSACLLGSCQTNLLDLHG